MRPATLLRRLGRWLKPFDAPEPSPDDLVSLWGPGEEAIALLHRDVLSKEGIPSMVRGLSPLIARGGEQMAAYELRVRYRDYGRARELLALDL